MAEARLNLQNVTGLLVDRDPHGRNLIARMLRGFGLRNLLVASTGEEGKKLLQAHCPDICFVEAALADMPTSEFVGWVRRQTSKALRFMPVIVLSGYTQASVIADVRDGGANMVVRKPVSPQALFDRINWVARVSRPYLESSTYVGPDRRFRALAPPDGTGRRSTDKPPDPKKD
jgi:CheY-like chemotaxis protein